jgi:hypothetical protein
MHAPEQRLLTTPYRSFTSDLTAMTANDRNQSLRFLALLNRICAYPPQPFADPEQVAPRWRPRQRRIRFPETYYTVGLRPLVIAESSAHLALWAANVANVVILMRPIIAGKLIATNKLWRLHSEDGGLGI